ncbi:MAG TPA: hypothetical protein VMF65_10105 [Acidimicrobiales bacterium]|nr:hypothetical protein [Acidimicrobiales bacterium]
MTRLDDRRADLAGLIRQYQRDTDAFDQAVADPVGLSRTDLRCVDPPRRTHDGRGGR